ncbi:hypothetical protein BGW38_005353 [Lunasporangiospora selenospora]|uniref:Uncharacterized protein n=1 Tax=Lunasporangiospora selenospora TaxID=979761 RepID=A0A9P6G2P5_9FUNG|nr:hypothetical protein BGW38_005353 [Lunasporangiospora selenospora]
MATLLVVPDAQAILAVDNVSGKASSYLMSSMIRSQSDERAIAITTSSAESFLIRFPCKRSLRGWLNLFSEEDRLVLASRARDHLPSSLTTTHGPPIEWLAGSSRETLPSQLASGRAPLEMLEISPITAPQQTPKTHTIRWDTDTSTTGARTMAVTQSERGDSLISTNPGSQSLSLDSEELTDEQEFSGSGGNHTASNFYARKHPFEVDARLTNRKFIDALALNSRKFNPATSDSGAIAGNIPNPPFKEQVDPYVDLHPLDEDTAELEDLGSTTQTLTRMRTGQHDGLQESRHRNTEPTHLSELSVPQPSWNNTGTIWDGNAGEEVDDDEDDLYDPEFGIGGNGRRRRRYKTRDPIQGTCSSLRGQDLPSYGGREQIAIIPSAEVLSAAAAAVSAGWSEADALAAASSDPNSVWTQLPPTFTTPRGKGSRTRSNSFPLLEGNSSGKPRSRSRDINDEQADIRRGSTGTKNVSSLGSFWREFGRQGK